jgi:preprotein translocase subunit SecF
MSENSNPVIHFMRLRKMAAVLSMLLVLVSLGSLASRHLAWGLDFTGGTLVEVASEQPIVLDDMRQKLAGMGQDKAIVQYFGAENDVLVRMPGEDPQLGQQLAAHLTGGDSGIRLQRVEFVGPQVGEELREQGGLAMLMALALIMLYIAFRFQFKFAIGAVTALIHDVVIVLGVFSIFRMTFDLNVLAAVLAVVGYSLNDTIVVSDRVRENFRIMRAESPASVIDTSLTQTLGRTLVTSGTTLVVLLALFLFGGESVRGFSLALIVGILVGTYSSIYVASSVLMQMGISRQDLVRVVHKPDEDEVEVMPPELGRKT